MNQIINEEIIIRENDLHEMQTYYDLSHVVNIYIRGHVVGVSTCILGVLRDNLIKNNMNPIISNKL